MIGSSEQVKVDPDAPSPTDSNLREYFHLWVASLSLHTHTPLAMVPTNYECLHLVIGVYFYKSRLAKLIISHTQT